MGEAAQRTNSQRPAGKQGLTRGILTPRWDKLSQDKVGFLWSVADLLRDDYFLIAGEPAGGENVSNEVRADWHSRKGRSLRRRSVSRSCDWRRTA